MPAEKRKTSSTPSSVPELGDPDRKRVLNVLAQRRYRQKRREKFAALEAQAKALTSNSSPDQPDDGGVTLKSSGPSRSVSSSEGGSTQQDAGPVEEVPRSRDDPMFSMVDIDPNPMEFPLFTDFGFSSIDFSTIPSPILSPSTLAPPNNNIEDHPKTPYQPSHRHPPSSSSSSSLTTPPNFPLTPDSTLSIPLLPVLRAFSTIASLLNIIPHVWNPLYVHTLPPNPNPSLPPNLQPTPAQISIPHHPILDILPWPSVREKLICVMALPEALRPPIARGDPDPTSTPTSPFDPAFSSSTPQIPGSGHGRAVAQIVQDLDDLESGVRVHGNLVGWGESSELVEEAWEVGETFYRNWWWCLDARVVEMANRRRRERGLGALRLEG